MSDIKKTCVQCGGVFTDAENKDGECGFHTSSYNSWNRRRACCTEAAPCVRKPHRAKHHCDYAYETFFARSSGILGYTDTVDEWGVIKETNAETNDDITVSVGQLLRWKSRGPYIADEHLLLVRVGTVWPGNAYFFHVFDPIELDEVGKRAPASGGFVDIFRTDPGSSQYGRAQWIVESQLVVGVRLEAKVATNDKPSIVDVRITPVPLAKVSTTVVQRGGIVEKRVKLPHALPAIVCNVAAPLDLAAIVPRDARDDFKTLDAISKRKELSLALATPLACNSQYVRNGRDRFDFHLQVINTGKESFMFLKFKVEWKLLNGTEWFPVPADDLDWGRYGTPPVPVTIGGMGSIDISGVVLAPFPDPADKDRRPWFYRSYLARHRPVRFRFTLCDAADNGVSRVFEYVQKISKLDGPRDSDTLFLTVDDADELDRCSAKIAIKDEGDTLAELDGSSFDIKAARKIVYQANKSGKSEIALDSFAKDKEQYTAHFWALVDRAAESIYAFKARIVHKKTGVAKDGYAAVRFYGADDAETVDGVPAVEEAKQPPASQSGDLPFVYEDKGFDELTDADITFAPPAPEPGAGGAAGGGGVVNVDLSSIESKLDALNANMLRIATALEALVAARR
jgi:hypothetical protein